MAKITRATAFLFGSSASSNQMAEFGSLFNTYPTVPTRYSGATITPALVQMLSNFETGWYGAAIGGNSPAIEDLNALCYLFSYQLAYLLQTGVPEWDSATTYYSGSITQDGSGNMYFSLTNSNLNNALTSTTNWQKIGGPASVKTKTANYNILAGDKLVLGDATSGVITLTLPDATLVTGNSYELSKIDSSSNAVDIATTSLQSISGSGSYVLAEQWQFMVVRSNGSNWNIVGAG